MGELTRTEVEDAFKNVLNSHEFAAQLKMVVTEIADDRLKAKMLLTFGIDCEEAEEINATRIDMRFLRQTREFSEGELSKIIKAVVWVTLFGAFSWAAFKDAIKASFLK